MNILLVGYGDVAHRVQATLMGDHYWGAVVRRVSAEGDLDVLDGGSVPNVVAHWDLDERCGLRLWQDGALVNAPLASFDWDVVVWMVPPAATGEAAIRLRHFLATYRPRAAGRLARVIYVGTTGVYGDCQGAWCVESQPLQPTTRRAQARAQDERFLADWAQSYGGAVVVLRVPGIYALQRLPMRAVLAGEPILSATEDVFSNHVHADDLAGFIGHCVLRVLPSQFGVECVNVCDDQPLLMGRWRGALAEVMGLPQPLEVSRAVMRETVSSLRYSYMCESRKVSNQKMKQWGYQLRYPSAVDFVTQYAAEIRRVYGDAGLNEPKGQWNA